MLFFRIMRGLARQNRRAKGLGSRKERREDDRERRASQVARVGPPALCLT